MAQHLLTWWISIWDWIHYSLFSAKSSTFVEKLILTALFWNPSSYFHAIYRSNPFKPKCRFQTALNTVVDSFYPSILKGSWGIVTVDTQVCEYDNSRLRWCRIFKFIPWVDLLKISNKFESQGPWPRVQDQSQLFSKSPGIFKLRCIYQEAFLNFILKFFLLLAL